MKLNPGPKWHIAHILTSEEIIWLSWLFLQTVRLSIYKKTTDYMVCHKQYFSHSLHSFVILLYQPEIKLIYSSRCVNMLYIIWFLMGSSNRISITAYLMTPNYQTKTKVLSSFVWNEDQPQIVFNVWIDDTTAVGVREIMKENNECFKHHQLIYYITNLFGTSTFNDENCIHTFQQVKLSSCHLLFIRIEYKKLYFTWSSSFVSATEFSLPDTAFISSTRKGRFVFNSSQTLLKSKSFRLS